jgi:hypothetical protein
MTHEQLLQARINEALESVTDIEDALGSPYPLTRDELKTLVTERLACIRAALSGADDHALRAGQGVSYGPL